MRVTASIAAVAAVFALLISATGRTDANTRIHAPRLYMAEPGAGKAVFVSLELEIVPQVQAPQASVTVVSRSKSGGIKIVEPVQYGDQDVLWIWTFERVR